MHSLSEIAVLVGVYKLCILAVGDCFTDLSTVLVFVIIICPTIDLT